MFERRVDGAARRRESRERARAPHGGASTAWRWDASMRTRLDTEGCSLPLARSGSRTRRAMPGAAAYLGDELRHLAVDLLEGLKPRMGFDHRSHGAASVEYEAGAALTSATVMNVRGVMAEMWQQSWCQRSSNFVNREGRLRRPKITPEGVAATIRTDPDPLPPVLGYAENSRP